MLSVGPAARPLMEGWAEKVAAVTEAAKTSHRAPVFVHGVHEAHDAEEGREGAACSHSTEARDLGGTKRRDLVAGCVQERGGRGCRAIPGRPLRCAALGPSTPPGLPSSAGLGRGAWRRRPQSRRCGMHAWRIRKNVQLLQMAPRAFQER
jgi:hypothetical protein